MKKRISLLLALMMLLSVSVTAFAESNAPGETWEYWESPEAAGFSSQSFVELDNALNAANYGVPSDEVTTTAMMVIKDGKIVWSWGDITHQCWGASMRKSVIDVLYGMYLKGYAVDESKAVLSLDDTLGELGIVEEVAHDEYLNGRETVGDTNLLEIELSATIRDLLMSSAGIYLPAANAAGLTEEQLASRGTIQPGSHFLYNNWEFNVLGTILAKATGNGESIWNLLVNDIAIPMQFEDFNENSMHYTGLKSISSHLAYHMFLSARDFARIGVLMLNKGNWNGKQLISEEWATESVKRQAVDQGYGYLWWLPERDAPGWADAYYASGTYGQRIICLPELNTVVVHRRSVKDETALARNNHQPYDEKASTIDQDVLYGYIDKLIAGMK